MANIKPPSYIDGVSHAHGGVPIPLPFAALNVGAELSGLPRLQGEESLKDFQKLRDALNHPDVTLRSQAAYQLGLCQVWRRPAIRALVKAVSDPDPLVQQLAKESLIRLGEGEKEQPVALKRQLAAKREGTSRSGKGGEDIGQTDKELRCPVAEQSLEPLPQAGRQQGWGQHVVAAVEALSNQDQRQETANDFLSQLAQGVTIQAEDVIAAFQNTAQEDSKRTALVFELSQILTGLRDRITTFLHAAQEDPNPIPALVLELLPILMYLLDRDGQKGSRRFRLNEIEPSVSVPRMTEKPTSPSVPESPKTVAGLLHDLLPHGEIRGHLRQQVASTAQDLVGPLNKWIKAQTAATFQEKNAVCHFVNDLLLVCGITFKFKKTPCYLSVSKGSRYPNGQIYLFPFGSSTQILSRKHFADFPELELTGSEHLGASSVKDTWTSQVTRTRGGTTTRA